ncbi:MAG TPA: universal stress protein [Polyangiales bacterium]|nr:universal stress protein [Polyangiales bacterium]
MTILCGTDFSAAAERALTAAAQLAARTQARLHLMHSVQFETGMLEGTLKANHIEWVTERLERQADRARSLGATVELHVKNGSPDEAMIALAAEVHAQLIVIGPLGGRAPGTYQLGGHAERLVQRSNVPVLIVRSAEAFSAWLEQKRTLRVMLGADLSRSTDAAMAFVDSWRRIAPCDVTAVHLYWPPQQFARLGLGGVRSYLDPDPDVTKTLTRELTHRLAREPESVSVYVEPHLGRLGDRLADLASQREADLLVVGTHARSTLGRIWEGSVSHWALAAARTSVLCVPCPSKAADESVPRMRSVLVATDFSPAGNAAVGLACGLAEPGGTIHVAHVLPVRATVPLAPRDIFSIERAAANDPRRAETHHRLATLLPADVRDRKVCFYALESDERGAAITQAALRLDADAICLGRRARSKLAQALLGSVSKDVLEHAECPVIFVQAPRE